MRALTRIGFAIVQASDYTEEEKSYIFEMATTIVLPAGAGITNVVYVKEKHASLVLLCPPSLQSVDNLSGIVPCSWLKNWFAKRYLSHLELDVDVVTHGIIEGTKKVNTHGSENRPWRLQDVGQTVADIRRYVDKHRREPVDTTAITKIAGQPLPAVGAKRLKAASSPSAELAQVQQLAQALSKQLQQNSGGALASPAPAAAGASAPPVNAPPMDVQPLLPPPPPPPTPVAAGSSPAAAAAIEAVQIGGGKPVASLIPPTQQSARRS